MPAYQAADLIGWKIDGGGKFLQGGGLIMVFNIPHGSDRNILVVEIRVILVHTVGVIQQV